MSQRFQDSASTVVREPAKLRFAAARQSYPAIVGTHGPRLYTYSTQLSPFDVQSVLGHDPRSDRRITLTDRKIVEIYDYMQRRTSAARRDAIRAYVEDRLFPSSDLIGGFPAIAIAAQQPADFDVIESLPGVVNVFIDTGMHNKRIVLDGLGRITAALGLVDDLLSGELDPDAATELEQILKSFQFPCVLYTPGPGQAALTLEELGQLFHDFNFKATPVSAKDAIALDQSDLYIRATYSVSEKSIAISQSGGMEKRAASLGAKSTAIVVQPVLLRFVRAALEGSEAVEKARNVAPKRAGEDRIPLARVTSFLDAFSETMGERWTQRDSVHLSSAGWQTLGIIFHEAVIRDPSVDERQVGRNLAEFIDWNRSSDFWTGLIVEKVSKKGERTLSFQGAGASTRREMVKRIREKLELA